MTIGERSWHAESWSVAGATVAGGLPGLVHGSSYPATLRFGGDTAIEIHTKVVAEIGDKGSRFVFHDVSGPHAEILHHLVDRHRNQAKGDFLHLLASANDNAMRNAGSAMARRMRVTVTFLFLCGLLAAAMWTLYLSFGTVSSAYAAVSAESRTVTMPMKGVLVTELPAPGSEVAAGQIVGEIASDEAIQRLTALKAEEIRLEESIGLAHGRIAELNELAKAEETRVLTERTVIESKLELATQRLDIETRQLDRARRLGSLTSERAVEEQIARVLSVTEEIKTIERDLAVLNGRLAHLPIKASASDLSAHTLTISSLNATIAADTASLAAVRAERDSLRRMSFIRSPCDCLVAEVHAKQGDRVAEQGVLAVLVDPRSTLVQALIPMASASGLRNGDKVRLELADHRKLEGKVAAISYQARNDRRIGLPDRFDEGRYARLDLLVPDVEPKDVGMVAHVRVLSRKAERLVGWDLIRDFIK